MALKFGNLKMSNTPPHFKDFKKTQKLWQRYQKGIIIFCTIAAITILLIVQNLQWQTATPPDDVVDSIATPDNSEPTQPPWQKLKDQQYRLQAQHILQNVLQNIKVLEPYHHIDWVGVPLQKITQLLATGDQLYAKTAYEQALNTYADALQRSQSLLQQYRQQINDLIARADTQFLQLDNQFIPTVQKLLTLAPNSTSMEQYKKNLPHFLEASAKYSAAKTMLQAQRYEAAQRQLQQVLQFFPQHKLALQLRRQMRQQKQRQKWQQQISAAYQMLNSGQLTNALALFQQLQKQKPHSKPIADGIQLVQIALSKKKTNKAITQIEQAQKAENWDNVQKHLKVLQTEIPYDTTLAQTMSRARDRALLEQQVAELLQLRYQFNIEKHRQRAYKLLQVVDEVIKKDSQTEKLQRQSLQLQAALDTQLQQITLTVQSNALSAIALQKKQQRVQLLGNINSSPIAVTPGYYRITSERAGYRDVINHIFVSTTRSITIRNVEPITP